MAKNKEVVLVRQQTIATYDVNDGFMVDVALFDAEKQVYDYWLYHKDCGTKVRYLSVPKSYNGYTNIAKPEDVVNCLNNSAFWDENKQHYTNNYLV